MLVVGAFGASCKDQPNLPRADGACAAGTAQIGVGDGFFQRICGCGGTDGEILVTPANLSCTFPAGTTVFIHYFGDQLMHRIVPDGALDFSVGPIFDPSDRGALRTFGFEIDTAGTYPFKNEYQVDMIGEFVVTP
jgi:hypothetical protein